MQLPTYPKDGQVRVAAIQAQAQEYATEADFEHKVMKLVEDAKAAGAQIAVFPEDIGLWLELSKRSPRILALRSIATLTSIANLAHSGFPTPADPTADSTVAPAGTPQILNVPEFEVLLGRFTDWIAGLIHVPFFGEWLGQSRIDQTYLGTMSLAAKKYGIVIVGGSIFEVRDDGIYITCYVFDTDGSIAGRYDKHHLVSMEKCFGAIPSTDPVVPIKTRDFNIGACICYDLNFGPTELDAGFREIPVALELKQAGAQLICAGSTGIRPWPNYPYRPAIDAPQIRRAQETRLSIVRAYQTGWLVPGIYMDGLSEIVLPDGTIAASSYPDYQAYEKIFISDVPLA